MKVLVSSDTDCIDGKPAHTPDLVRMITLKPDQTVNVTHTQTTHTHTYLIYIYSTRQGGYVAHYLYTRYDDIANCVIKETVWQIFTTHTRSDTHMTWVRFMKSIYRPVCDVWMYGHSAVI